MFEPAFAKGLAKSVNATAGKNLGISDVPAQLGLVAPALAWPEGASAFSNPWPSQGQCRGPGSGLAAGHGFFKAIDPSQAVAWQPCPGSILCRLHVPTHILTALRYHGPANRTCAPSALPFMSQNI